MSEPGVADDHMEFLPWQIPSLGGQDGHSTSGGASIEEKAEAILNKAYAEGFESGRKEGVDTARRETAEQVNQFIEIANSLSCATEAFDEQIAQDLVALATTIAEQIILREISISPELLLGMVEKIINNLPEKKADTSIFLNPLDATAFSDYLSGNEDLQWRIVHDPEMNRGDCRLESNDSIVQYRLHDQIDGILSASLEYDAQQSDTA